MIVRIYETKAPVVGLGGRHGAHVVEPVFLALEGFDGLVIKGNHFGCHLELGFIIEPDVKSRVVLQEQRRGCLLKGVTYVHDRPQGVLFGIAEADRALGMPKAYDHVTLCWCGHLIEVARIRWRRGARACLFYSGALLRTLWSMQ